MVRSVTFLLLLVFSFAYRGWTQVALSETDLRIDFPQRFYDRNQLITENTYVYTDSAYIYFEQDLLNDGKDLSDYRKHKHGKWLEYFDKNWNSITDKEEMAYYSLTEYYVGTAKGSAFFFDKKDRLHHATLRHPPYGENTFEGFRVIWFDQNEQVKTIQYERFRDQLDLEYVNRTTYFSNGKIESYTLRDEEQSNYHIVEYDKEGKITYELIANNKEQSKVKYKRRGKVELRESREDGVSYKSKRVKGELKWRKKM